MKSSWKNIAEPVLFFIVLLVLWEILVEVIKVPVFILPPPRDLWTSFIQKMPILGNHSMITFIEAFGGFSLSLLLGVGFAIAVVYSRHLQNTVYPLIVILYAMPKSAFAPLMVIWVGYGLVSKIAIACRIAKGALTCTLPREPIWIWSTVTEPKVSRKKIRQPTQKTGLLSW